MTLNRCISTVRPRESGDPACPSVLGTNLSAVVPAQAGTHNHQGFGYRRPSHIALLQRMGPRLRGDDRGESLLHFFVRGNERLSADRSERETTSRGVAR